MFFVGKINNHPRNQVGDTIRCPLDLFFTIELCRPCFSICTKKAKRSTYNFGNGFIGQFV
jgi:hypothetical protein